MLKAVLKFVPMILGFAMVLASLLIMLSIVGFGWQYILMSLLFLIGFVLIFWERGEKDDRVGVKTN